MALIKCPECGSDISDKSDKCIKCGCPLNYIMERANKPKKKNIVPFIALTVAIIAIVIIVIIAIYFTGKNKKEDGLYNNIAWGTSYEDVKKIVESNNEGIVDANDNQRMLFVDIEEYKGDKDVFAMILYDCRHNETLCEISIMVMNNGDIHSDIELFKKYKEELSEFYGEGTEEINGIKWTTSKSIIKLMYLADGLIVFKYTDINYNEE